jgi:succinylarginine dihydrolase
MFASIQSQPGHAAEIHAALPSLMPLRDEGAANHMRLCDATGNVGLNIFVYGESDGGQRPRRFLPRQTLAACQAIARLHRLDPERTFFLQQHPAAIDAGVFHNDVIATSHENVLLYHERAFVDADAELARLESVYARLCGRSLIRVCIPERELTLSDAVSSYLFNSQLLSPARGAATPVAGRHVPRMLLLCAADCARMPHVAALIAKLIADDSNPIEAAHFVCLDESMHGGGGPACLRLRIQLPQAVVASFAPKYRFTPEREALWRRVIESSYPEELNWSDLAEPECLSQFAAAQAALAATFSDQ